MSPSMKDRVVSRRTGAVSAPGLSGLAIYLALMLFWPAQLSPQALNIPANHPRLWWTPERLMRAKSWYRANPFTPASDDPIGNAMRYLMTGDPSYARVGVNWMLDFTISSSELSGVSSDNARWSGENVIVVYDWCHDQMTPAEQTTIITRWNGYLTKLMQNSDSGSCCLTGAEGNNYNWGYL